MKKMDIKFPEIRKSIEDLIADEEGSIPRTKLVKVGSMVMLMGILMGFDICSAHSSHSSHSSHTSHSSTSYHRSHVSHTSHTSGSNHSSHASHSNTHASHASHSNTHASHASHSSSIDTHSSHNNSNTSPSHSNTLSGSVPGTKEIPIPEAPQENSFDSEVPEVVSGIVTHLTAGETKDPKLE